MNYQEALKRAKKVGANKAQGLPYLALVCETLACVHAINPGLVYEGARKMNLEGDAVRKLDPVALGNLMFE